MGYFLHLWTEGKKEIEREKKWVSDNKNETRSERERFRDNGVKNMREKKKDTNCVNVEERKEEQNTERKRE